MSKKQNEIVFNIGTLINNEVTNNGSLTQIFEDGKKKRPDTTDDFGSEAPPQVQEGQTEEA